MKNISKTLVILILFVLFFIPAIKSLGINMNLEPMNIQTNTTDDNNLAANTHNNTSSSTFHKTVTVTSSDDDEFLTIENVLSIILIVIGILLIFLGIAIIIRFK